MLLACLVGIAAVLSMPAWLPRAIVALRMRIFTHINGDEGIAIPGEDVDAAHFKEVYSHPAAVGRSEGAPLSNLFWYWLSPGPEMHQEHLEPGERYEAVARTTRRVLAIPRQTADELTVRSVARALSRMEIRAPTAVRLRDFMMPIWAYFYYELVFGEPCPEFARKLIVDNADDVVTALKCCGLRHMNRRDRLTQFLVQRIEAGAARHALPSGLSTLEGAQYLQGVFFNTAIVQMSEAMAHLFMVMAQHFDTQTRFAANLNDDRLLDRLIWETFRLYPLFGISHRITTADIPLEGRGVIPSGSVLCFNHPEYHRSGFEEPDSFEPDRWETLSVRDANYIPFGVAANRACPAQGLAMVTMHTAARELIQRFAFVTSAAHTRSLPNRGPCLVLPRNGPCEPGTHRARLAFMRVADQWEDVWRSLVQLVLGTYMVLEARQLRLCDRYFAAQKT